MTQARGDHKVLMVGLPGAGKSTYLGAFWNAVEKAHDTHAVKLVGLLPSDRVYLNSLRDDWLEFKKLGRTQEDETRHSPLSVSFGGSENVSLNFPDISGETFRDMVESRHWPLEFHEVIDGATELMVFLNPLLLKDGPTILDAVRMEGEIVDDQTPPDQSEQASIELGKPWTRALIPTQVKLIDIVQLITLKARNAKIRKISVIVSAWDAVENTSPSPKDYVRINTPMLYQFLEAGSVNWDYRVFGVSAQGGDYENDASLRELLRLADPINRPRIAGISKEEAQQNDITFPIRWLFT